MAKSCWKTANTPARDPADRFAASNDRHSDESLQWGRDGSVAESSVPRRIATPDGSPAIHRRETNHVSPDVCRVATSEFTPKDIARHIQFHAVPIVRDIPPETFEPDDARAGLPRMRSDALHLGESTLRGFSC